jgi:hypothetical protein
MLERVVYLALREDPANASGRYSIRFRPGGFTFEIETSGGGLHYLVYQAIEDSVASSSSTSSPSASRRRQVVHGLRFLSDRERLPLVTLDRRHFEPLTILGLTLR